ncbi:MAG: DNA-3-methyladenine glycosylase I [Pseudomonadota bacterium]
MQKLTRCKWVTADPIYVDYHDTEWGVSVHNDKKLFEFLILEGAQAGLSWLTVLKKRANYQKCFDDFVVEKVARYSPAKIDKLLQNEGIIRNRLKVTSAVGNARAVLAVQKEWGTFAKYIWHFVDGATLQNNRRSFSQIPARTEISDKMSKDLKKRGFKFVGSTICYAFMQAVGMVNDHTMDCFCHQKAIVKKNRKKETS